MYALALLGALAFRVAYTGWLGGFVLAGVACLPLLGVVTALPGLLSCKLTLAPGTERGQRGEELFWRLEGKSALGLPLGWVGVTVETVNELTGETSQEKTRWFLPGEGGTAELAVPSGHCGLLTGRMVRAWAADSLGLFRLPLRRGGEAQCWVEPIPRSRDLPPLPEEEAPGVRPRPGGGPGEDYDPREYRPGDPLHSIHWKLSAKRDALVTRETLETVRPNPLLTFDCFGRPEELDALLDLLSGMSLALLDRGRPHTVAWAEPVTGELRRFDIAREEDRRRCLEAVLSQRAPGTGKSVLDGERLGRSLHLQGGGGE